MRAGPERQDRLVPPADGAARDPRGDGGRSQHRRGDPRGRRVRSSSAALGQLAAIGQRTGVAQIFGITFSGFVAWWLWRTIYLSKLPRFEKKVRVAIDWTLDLFFRKDFVQYLTPPPAPMPIEERPVEREARELVGAGM